jgi:hypothetical protein
MDRTELDQLSTEELHDRAMARARSHADVGFLWSVARALPAAEIASGHPDRSGADIVSLTSLISDFLRSGEGDVGEALRPLYVDYLEKHPG